ncbi:mannosyltransferase [Mycolicibacterium frederiksbergense]|uniref:mannosyltransferase n=1 Tax=Mycolicibacterium frederiksbergense TaxID=117567 RepID=UPI0021F3091E|nr:mannosyltransferase [Mycolicibacterium frederiksbergense]
MGTESNPSVRSRFTRLESLAPALLAISVFARLASTTGYYLVAGDAFFDLRIYVLGGAALNDPGTLYEFFYVDPLKNEQLPFTYPPFAAMVFYPLHLLPFGLVAFLWQTALVAAVYASVRLCQRMVGGGSHRIAMLWTAVAIWMEAPGGSIQVGQIGIFLMLAVLYAVYSTRWWVSGLLIGVTAGIKLTPAITGLYFVGVRRWGAAIFSAVVFFATIGLAFVLLPDETRRYFPGRMSEAGQDLPVGSFWNQSWRGGLSRIAGHDVGTGALVICALAATAVLAVLAWRALGSVDGQRDLLGSLLVTQIFGLLASPVAWTHHWVWVVPLLIWLFHGPWRQKPGARVLGWIWFVLMIFNVPTLLASAQSSIYDISQPWYLAWAGLAYIVAALGTMSWMIATGRHD